MAFESRVSDPECLEFTLNGSEHLRCGSKEKGPDPPKQIRAVSTYRGRLFLRDERILADAADGTNPGVRDVFELRAGRDAAIRIADDRVIHVAAHGAQVFHGSPPGLGFVS